MGKYREELWVNLLNFVNKVSWSNLREYELLSTLFEKLIFCNNMKEAVDKVHRKTPVLSSLCNNVAGLLTVWAYQKRLRQKYFLVNIGKFFIEYFLQITASWLLLTSQTFGKTWLGTPLKDFGRLYSQDISDDISRKILFGSTFNSFLVTDLFLYLPGNTRKRMFFLIF